MFKLKNINWIVITKDITEKEREFLNINNINYYGDIIDQEYSFYDSINIIKNVKGIITTDTSIAHVSLNLNITTYILLSKYSDWRWNTTSENNKLNWYPNAHLIRQNKIHDWSNVIESLLNIIKK